jgi:hypothetical protein
MKALVILNFLLLMSHASVTPVQADSVSPVLEGLSTLSDADIREYAIAFVNMTTSPGLEGATLTVDNDERQSDQWRSSLGFNAEFTLRDHIFNGYWGLAIIGGRLEDKIEFIADNGKPVQLDITREVVGLRGSLGLSFPIDRYFKLRPFLSLIISDLQNEIILDDQYVLDYNLPSNRLNTSAQMWTGVGSLEALYNRWYGNYQLQLSGQYHINYTDSFSEDNPILVTEAWNDSARLKVMFGGPTRLSSAGRPWRWNTYANYVNFLSTNTAALGYNSYVEIGAGLDWELNIRPLDLFGLQFVGIKAGLIVGENVEGYSAGLTAR